MKNDDCQKQNKELIQQKTLLIELIQQINKTLENNFKRISELQN